MTLPADASSPRDLEEVLAPETLVLPYDPASCRVLSGQWRGAIVMQVEAFEALRLRSLYGGHHAMTVFLRPWWRLWRLTPARVITPVVREGLR